MLMAVRHHLTRGACFVAATVLVVGCGDGEVAGDAAVPATTTAAAPATAPTSTPTVTTMPTAPAPGTPTGAPATAPAAPAPSPAPAGTAPPATAPAAPAPAPAPSGVTSGPDVAAVRLTIQGYLTAFADGDGASACALLTPESQQQFLAAVRTEVAATTCADAFSEVADQAPDALRSAFRDAPVSDVVVTGNRARGVVTFAGRSNTVTLEKRQSQWMISNAPGS